MNSLANKMQQQTYRISELEEDNIRVSANHEEDRRTIQMLEERLHQATLENE